MRDLALKDKDKEVYEIIENEKYRMWGNMNLIASENYPSRTVLECSGSILTHKATEGYPGHRHYGTKSLIIERVILILDGVEQYDKLESLCHTRACDAFHISQKDWAINCQALSGNISSIVS
jgi:glycine hydroxymethyltransferase